MNQNSPRDGPKAILQARLTAAAMLLHDKLTPFLQAQTCALIIQYEDAIKRIDRLSGKECDLLDDQFFDLQSHWNFLHENLTIRASFTENLIHLQQFLTASLLEDYAGRPYSPSRYALDCASMVVRDFEHLDPAGKAKDGSDDLTTTVSANIDQSNTQRLPADMTNYIATTFAADIARVRRKRDSKSGTTSTSKAQDRRNSTVSSLLSSPSGSDSEGITHGEDVTRTSNAQERRISTASSLLSSPSGSDSDEGSTNGEDVSPAPSGRESYAWDVLVPAAELILDDNLVVQKLAMVDPRLRYPGGGEVTRLIEQRDWAQLLATLEADRRLAQTLFTDPPVQKGTFNGATRDAVLRGIEAVEKKYFASVGDSSRSAASRTLTASGYALELSAGKQPVLEDRVPDAGTHGGPQAVGQKRSWKYWETALGKHVSSLYETLAGTSSDVASRGGGLYGSKAYTSSDVGSMGEKRGLLAGHSRRNEEAKDSD